MPRNPTNQPSNQPSRAPRAAAKSAPRNATILLTCLAAAGAIVACAMEARRAERLRDARVLLAEAAASCSAALGEGPQADADRAQADPWPLRPAALWALTRETLAIVDELIGPVSPRERDGAAGRHGERLSNAVSERVAALELELQAFAPAVAATGGSTDFETGSRAPKPRQVERPLAGSPQVASPETPDGVSQPPPKPAEGEPQRIQIRAVSGESWEEIRRRRARERSARAGRWREVADRELEPVLSLRRALAEELRVDSLEGSSDLCVRLGIASAAADRVVVREAPNRAHRLAVERALEAYEAAGTACAEAAWTLAFVALTDGDAAWRRVAPARTRELGRPGRADLLAAAASERRRR